jgi:hypothetical protein
MKLDGSVHLTNQLLVFISVVVDNKVVNLKTTVVILNFETTIIEIRLIFYPWISISIKKVTFVR